MEDHSEQILADLRKALRDTSGTESRTVPPASFDPVPDDLAMIFAEKLKNVGGHFAIARGVEELTDILVRLVTSRGIRSMAFSDAPIFKRLDLHRCLAPHLDRLSVLSSRSLPQYERLKVDLEPVQLGVTSCRFAIADTGTLLLTAEDETNRLISLLPAIHVAVFTPEQLVPNLRDALRHLQAAGPLSRAITLVTGPSRTGDIEFTLTVGVHGPEEAHAILLQC